MGGRNTKNLLAQGKVKLKQNSCTPNNLKNIPVKAQEKSYKKNVFEKKYHAAQKIPTLPITFLMVRSQHVQILL